MSTLLVRNLSSVSARQLARTSTVWAVPSSTTYDAELIVATLVDEAVVLGAFQRATDVDPRIALPRLSRGSGGAAVRVGPGTVWVQLRLARASALVACEPARLLNRYVRPLLRALAREGAPATYHDRDWIAVERRPAGLVAFGHDSAAGTCVFEAFVAASTPFALSARPSFRGKAPSTLAALGHDLDPDAMRTRIVAAYGEGHELVATDAPLAGALGPVALHELDAPAEPPWTAVRDEAIGPVAAGFDAAGRLRVGGELMASRDAVARLEEAAASMTASTKPDELAAVVDALLGAPGVVVFGVRSLTSIRDVVLETLAHRQ